MYEGKKWSVLAPPGAIETDFSYEFPTHFDYHGRGALYYAVISSVKNYGTATFYLDIAETPDGEWLDGGSNYKLVVPQKVPARDFWSVVAYDLETAAWIRDMPKVGIDSARPDLVANENGSVDVYFGRRHPTARRPTGSRPPKIASSSCSFASQGPPKAPLNLLPSPAA